VVFLTPIVLHAAWSRGVDDRPFLYGTVLMSNSASLLLPGSNLTNLLVLGSQHVSGAAFVAAMFPAWAAAVLVTAAVLIAWRRRGPGKTMDGAPSQPRTAPRRYGLGLAAIVVAGALVLTLSDPALPVLALGPATASCQVALRRLPPTAAARTLSAPLLLGVFVLAVGLGSAARLWGTPAQLMQTLAPWQTAGFAAGASVIVNNLPAAMLLASGVPAHPRALLIGLNLGPNLALSGSLSALLWMRVARATGAKPSAATYTRLGLVLVPCSIAAALVALILFAPHGHVI
jgi:arsenical pump membrane protein